MPSVAAFAGGPDRAGPERSGVEWPRRGGRGRRRAEGPAWRRVRVAGGRGGSESEARAGRPWPPPAKRRVAPVAASLSLPPSPAPFRPSTRSRARRADTTKGPTRAATASAMPTSSSALLPPSRPRTRLEAQPRRALGPMRPGRPALVSTQRGGSRTRPGRAGRRERRRRRRRGEPGAEASGAGKGVVIRDPGAAWERRDGESAQSRPSPSRSGPVEALSDRA